jgi:catalase
VLVVGRLPLRPGGEVRSPARLARDSADHLVNVVRRQRHRDDDGLRPVHAVGITARGRFQASGDLLGMTTTPMLSVGSSEAVARFSSFGNLDWSRKPDLRGLACRLIDDQGDGAELDLVAMTAPRFIVRREDDFLEFPSGVPRRLLWALTRRTTFTALFTAFRFTKAGLPVLGHRPRPLADERFFGVNTFWLTRAGSYRAMRYHWKPAGHTKLARPRLDEELAAMVQADGGVRFDLVVDVFDEGTSIRRLHDAMRRWPTWEREWPVIRSRARWRGTQRIVGGRLTLTEMAPPGATEGWLFNPVPTVEGFEASDDEILQARGSAYTASHVRRTSWTP